MKFNWLDLVFFVLALRGFYVGVRRGILGELTLTLSLLATVLAASLLSPRWGEILSERFSLGLEFSLFSAAWGTVILGVVLSFLLAKIISKLSHLFIQGGLDKAVGSLLGGARALLLTAILIFALMKLPSEFFQRHAPESVIGSFLTSRIGACYDYLREKTLPADLSEVEEVFEDLDESP